MSLLFTPLTLRSVTLPNRIAVSPMCQLSAGGDGVPTDWHLVHLGSRAVGGAGLVIAEATAVEPRGLIMPSDTGIWNDEQAEAWRPIAKFIKENGSVPAIQLAHAGRKANGNWTPVSPATEPFPGLKTPEKLDEAGVREIISFFVSAARRAVHAGFEIIEIHAAHGYLLHQFYSPLTNEGTLEERIAVPLAVTAAVRDAVDVPVFVRISGTDWTEDGWTVEDSVVLAQRLVEAGADLIDVSSGGNTADAVIPVGPGYQVPLAETVRRKADVPTGAVGLITEARQAEQVLADGSADLVLLARELLRDPYWPLRAAQELGVEVNPPRQYAGAF